MQHKVFLNIFRECLRLGRILEKMVLMDIMKYSGLHNIHKESTYARRAFTVASWLNWTFKLSEYLPDSTTY